MPGERIALAGFVLDRRCRPVAGALLDLWHCDAAGEYDNDGYRLRGHQFSDAEGRFVFETIVPGKYPGRTRHYHVKVQAPGRSILTTQLYFPGEPGNEDDRIFDSALLLDIPLGRGPNLARVRFRAGSRLAAHRGANHRRSPSARSAPDRPMPVRQSSAPALKSARPGRAACPRALGKRISGPRSCFQRPGRAWRQSNILDRRGAISARHVGSGRPEAASGTRPIRSTRRASCAPLIVPYGGASADHASAPPLGRRHFSTCTA